MQQARNEYENKVTYEDDQMDVSHMASPPLDHSMMHPPDPIPHIDAIIPVTPAVAALEESNSGRC